MVECRSARATLDAEAGLNDACICSDMGRGSRLRDGRYVAPTIYAVASDWQGKAHSLPASGSGRQDSA